jgi:hypothetical protein
VALGIKELRLRCVDIAFRIDQIAHKRYLALDVVEVDALGNGGQVSLLAVHIALCEV